uniref:Uncharacterized protein n=1 Tax=Anguilla anguilla TaxID=7936 RepID=A0A0E9XAF3_ANGAN
MAIALSSTEWRTCRSTIPRVAESPNQPPPLILSPCPLRATVIRLYLQSPTKS